MGTNINDVNSCIETKSLTPNAEWMTVDDMANYLKIGRSTAYELVHKKDFPVVRVGRIFRISRAHLLAWLQGQCLS